MGPHIWIFIGMMIYFFLLFFLYFLAFFLNLFCYFKYICFIFMWHGYPVNQASVKLCTDLDIIHLIMFWRHLFSFSLFLYISTHIEAIVQCLYIHHLFNMTIVTHIFVVIFHCLPRSGFWLVTLLFLIWAYCNHCVLWTSCPVSITQLRSMCIYRCYC